MHTFFKLSASAWLVIFLACGADPNASTDSGLARQDAGQLADTENFADSSNPTSDSAAAPDQATQTQDARQAEQDAGASGPDAAIQDAEAHDSEVIGNDSIVTDVSSVNDATQTLGDASSANDRDQIVDATQPDANSSIQDAALADTNPRPSFADDEITLLKQLYDMPSILADDTESLILLLGQAILFCGHKNGTMTQDANGGWVCQADDSGHMLIQYYNGAVVDYTISQADAYLLGTAQDFADSHILDFVATQTGWFNLRIYSATWPDANVSGKTGWARLVSGTDRIFDKDCDVEFSDSGDKKSEVSGSFASYDINHTYGGNATATSSHFQFNESRRSLQMHDSSHATHVMNFWRSNNGSAELSGHNYSFDALGASWATGSVLGNPGTFNKVADSNFWVAQGHFTRDGQSIAEVLFDGPVIENSSGPNLALRPTVGDDIVLEATTDSP